MSYLRAEAELGVIVMSVGGRGEKPVCVFACVCVCVCVLFAKDIDVLLAS